MNEWKMQNEKKTKNEGNWFSNPSIKNRELSQYKDAVLPVYGSTC